MIQKTPEEFLEEAERWLAGARSVAGKAEVVEFVKLCHGCLEAAGCKPAAIGTTKAELETLKRNGYRACAAQYLDHARKEAAKKSPVLVVDGYITIMLRFLELSGGEPEDIGTSFIELEKLLDLTSEV